MAALDTYIAQINQFQNLMYLKYQTHKTLNCLQVTNGINSLLFFNEGRKVGSKIVLKKDVFLELGGPDAGSCEITLYTNIPAQIEDGRITIIGPDVNEAKTKAVPFAQIIMVGGEKLTEEDYYCLLQNLNISELIEGFMIRSTTENIWCRVSREAAKNGFNFQVLGSVLNWKIRKILPEVQSVEIIFVTTAKEDVAKLNQIGAGVREIARSIKERIWLEKGIDIYKCLPGGHCGACKDKAICDNIRRIGKAQ